jgi:hypothetical protein
MADEQTHRSKAFGDFIAGLNIPAEVGSTGSKIRD